MQLASYLGWEVVLKCRPGGSRTLDVVRSVGFLNEGFGVFRVFWGFFFSFHVELKMGAASNSQRREKEGHTAGFTASFSIFLDATLCSALAVCLLWG